MYLTLTATPIPRTLQFSLMAARDLSVITTPPPNRILLKVMLFVLVKKPLEMPLVMKFNVVDKYSLFIIELKTLKKLLE